MAEIVNLNRFRKTRERLEAARQAAENRTTFGRRKDDRDQARRDRDRAQRQLDGKRLDE